MKFFVLWLWVLCCGSETLLADAPVPGPGELTFTERNPLSSVSTLAARFSLPKTAGTQPADYDLSQHSFLVYFPKSTSADQPMGLIVLALYKHADELPAQIEPELDAANIAMIVPKDYLDPWYDRAGLCIDAAYNVQKKYTIKPRRVYVFGGSDWPDKDGYQTSVAWRLGLSYSDVFTGMFTTEVRPYRVVKAENGAFFRPDMPHPPAAQFAQSKLHPLVDGYSDDQQQFFFKSLKTDGFQFAEALPITPDQVHYPNFQTGWLPSVLQFMDASTTKLKLPKKLATSSRPTTQ